MADWLDILGNTVGAGAGAGGGFFALKWITEYIGGRMDKRAAALDAGTQRLIEQLEARTNKLAERLDKVERELAECQAKHSLSEAKAVKLEALLLATKPGLKLAFPLHDDTPEDMLAAARKLDGGA